MAKRKPEASTETETCWAVVFKKTPDGFVVGRALVAMDGVEWCSPTHVRDVQETRPQDVVLKAEKVLNEAGLVELKPKRVAKGVPVLTTVGKQVVFGEQHDTSAKRARDELTELMKREWKVTAPHWRHLCAESKLSGLPMLLSTRVGRACTHCGLTERETKTRGAA